MTVTLDWLGVPTVLVGSRPVRLGIKAVSVLALLSLEGRVARRELGRWLWGGANDALNSVSSVRVALGRALGSSLIGGDAEHLWLKGEWTSDVAAFQAALGSTDASVWKSAWASWRGPFLDGLHLRDWERGYGEEFEEWLHGKREALHGARAELAVRLARFSLGHDNFQVAVGLLSDLQATLQEPREDAARLLLLAHGALGERDAALGVYARLERHLHDSLGLAPAANTRAALEASRAGPTQSAAALRAELDLGVRLALSPPVFSDAPFVGREAELHSLIQAAFEPSAGARALLVVGEPGAGKTRLLREAVAGVLAADPEASLVQVTLHATGLPFEGGMGVVQQLLKFCGAQLEGLPAVWRELLRRVETSPSDLGDSAKVLFAAVLALVQADRRRVVIAVNDLQWADAATTELIGALLGARNVILALTLRDTESPRASLDGLLGHVTRGGHGVRVRLGGLSLQELRALTAQLGRTDVDAAQLHRSSGGNPFYALELLRGAPEITRAHDIVAVRLSALSKLERQVLEALAVLGDEATVLELRAVSGHALEEVSAALEGLRQAALLRLDERIRFVHDLTREVIARELGAAREALLHLRAARGSQGAGGAMHHWVSRALWDDTDRSQASLAFLEAGRVHARHGDARSSAEWFERALMVAPDIAARIGTLTEIAQQRERFGQHALAFEALDAAQGLLEVGFDPLLAGDAAITRARILALKLGRPGDAEAHVNRALDWLEHSQGAPPTRLLALRADALSVAGTVARLRGDTAGAVTHFQHALTLRRALNEPWGVAGALNNLATALLQRGDRAAHGLLEEAIGLSESSGDVVGLARALNNLGVYHNELGGRPEDARSVYGRVLELQRGIGDWWGIAAATLNLGVTAYLEGWYVEARGWYEETLALARAHDLAERRAEALYNLAEVHVQLGALEEAGGLIEALRLEPNTAADVKLLERTLERARGER